MNNFYKKMGGYCPSCLKEKVDCICLQDYFQRNKPEDFEITISMDELKELLIQAHYNGQSYSIASIRMAASYANKIVKEISKDKIQLNQTSITNTTKDGIGFGFTNT